MKMPNEKREDFFDDKSEMAEQLCEILERDSRRYSGFRETETES